MERINFYFTYDPQRSSAKNVVHLLAENNRFIATTTFPDVHNCEIYAGEYGSQSFYSEEFYFLMNCCFCLKLMKSINDLRNINFDYLVAKDNQVALRYSAERSHSGESHKG